MGTLEVAGGGSARKRIRGACNSITANLRAVAVTDFAVFYDTITAFAGWKNTLTFHAYFAGITLLNSVGHIAR